MASEEILVDFTAGRDILISEARSTLITTSIQAIRARGRFDEYERVVAPEHRETILTVVAGVWLPISVAAAHYAACNALGWSPDQQLDMGMEVGRRVQGTMLGLMVRTAKQAGLTPWAGLTQCTKLHERLFNGGSVKLVKLGPKEARIEMVQNPLFAFPYFRNAFRGVILAGGALFCEKMYVHELLRHGGSDSLGLRISWA
jgi:hypothetical protein